MKKFAIGVGVIFLSFVMVGSGYAGYVCSGTIFSDVNSTTEPAFCGFIEYFYALGITGGCGVSPLR